MIPDEELFFEWQKGSGGAFEALVRRHYAPLVGYMYRLVGERHLAEDLAQETLFRLVRYVDVYQYPRPFMPWLYSIARNLVINEKKSAYHRHKDLRISFTKFSNEVLDPYDWLHHWEQHYGIQTAMASLSFEHREALVLRFGQELSVKCIAQILGIPEGTAKSRIYNALRQLRKQLEHGNFQQKVFKENG